MKKTVSISRVILAALFIMAIFFSVYSKPALADAPQNVTIQYLDDEGGAIAVTITHASTNPSVEFVKSVEISINGTAYATYTYNRQPMKKRFTYVYALPPVEKGAVIDVTVDSSMYGSKSAKIVIP
jgi:hypothetical protein